MPGGLVETITANGFVFRYMADTGADVPGNGMPIVSSLAYLANGPCL
jgi:hypothetical protein